MLLSRTDLARTAINKADEVRDQFEIEPYHAVNIFDMCGERITPSITVRFKDISMEGLYLREDREIWLGLRPLTRRVFNCAHELGHFAFKHGSTLDELQEACAEHHFNPNEYLADTFAAYLLMPRLAVTSAYAVRNWKPESSTPAQCFVVSNSLGVGYETLANQLTYGLRLVSGNVAETLLKTRLPAVRASLLGPDSPSKLQMIDKHYTLSVVDTEVGTSILFPLGASPDGRSLVREGVTGRGTLLRAEKPGLTRVATKDGWGVVVRVMRHQYVGLSRFRNLEVEDDDE